MGTWPGGRGKIELGILDVLIEEPRFTDEEIKVLVEKCVGREYDVDDNDPGWHEKAEAFMKDEANFPFGGFVDCENAFCYGIQIVRDHDDPRFLSVAIEFGGYMDGNCGEGGAQCPSNIFPAIKKWFISAFAKWIANTNEVERLYFDSRGGELELHRGSDVKEIVRVAGDEVTIFVPTSTSPITELVGK